MYLFSQIFLHNLLHYLGTRLRLAVVHHQVMLETVQATLGLHVIYRGCEDPASEHNSKDPVSQTVSSYRSVLAWSEATMRIVATAEP